ncbi:MAG: hypothetical protein ACHQQS_15275 [Thermoanaerobaculales bacterium]
MASSANRKQAAYLVLLTVVLAVVIMYRVRPALVAGVLASDGKAVQVGNYQVPELGWDKDEVRAVPSPGTGRNLFSYGAPPTPTPDLRPTPTPRPTIPPGPPPPTPTPVCFPGAKGDCLPAPPQFTLTYLGWLGPSRLPIAVFRDGEQVLAVALGESVKQRFIIREVGPTAVTVGFTGYAPSVTNRVPLAK